MTTEKLTIGICKYFDDGSQSQLKRLMNGYDVDFLEFESSLEILKSLLDGEIDLAGISGSSAFKLGFSSESNVSGLEISSYLPRREPTSVIVSKDKLEHLPRNGRVYANSELIRRQLRRFRSDLELCGKSDLNLNDLNQDKLIEKLQELYVNNDLDGYVLERSEWNNSEQKGRRHTLGMQIGNNDSRQRFIPSPLRGFSLLISRIGFPSSILEELNDEHSMISFRVESKIFLELGKDELLGINASIRRISTIKKSLIEEGGLTSDILDEKLEFLEKYDSKSEKPVQMVEVIMEKIDEKGQITYSLEKKYIPDDDEYRIITMFLQEWEKMIELRN